MSELAEVLELRRAQSKRNRRLDNNKIEQFILAGNSTFTVENPETGNRFTYKVTQKENENGTKTPHFVSVLRGSDNTGDYSYIGFVKETSNGQIFIHGGYKAKAGKDAPSVKAFTWIWSHRDDLTPAEFYHEGRCGKCGRKLTVPESIESGFGPHCAESLS